MATFKHLGCLKSSFSIVQFIDDPANVEHCSFSINIKVAVFPFSPTIKQYVSYIFFFWNRTCIRPYVLLLTKIATRKIPRHKNMSPRPKGEKNLDCFCFVGGFICQFVAGWLGGENYNFLLQCSVLLSLWIPSVIKQITQTNMFSSNRVSKSFYFYFGIQLLGRKTQSLLKEL